MDEENIIDIRPDEQDEADDEPGAPELETQAIESEGDDEDDGPDIPQMAKRASKRLLKAAEGRSELDRAENAIEDAHEALQHHEQQYAQIQSRIRETESRITRLENTRVRVEELGDDASMFQQLEGGIIAEVSGDDERERVLDEIDETVEALEENVSRMEQRSESMETEQMVRKRAIKRLRNHVEMLSE